VKQHDASLLALIELIRARVRKDFEIVGGFCFLGILKYHYVAVINMVTFEMSRKKDHVTSNSDILRIHQFRAKL
jgi:hypothetical protein